MTVSLETQQFVGMVKDVTEFAPSARDSKRTAYVRISWDGTALRVGSFAEIHGAVATWSPPAAARSLDGPWDVLLRTAQAKDLAKFFELNGGKGTTPISLYSRHGELNVSRPVDEESGVDARRQVYVGDIEAIGIKYVEKEFADLGEAVARPVRIGPAAHVALGKAAKRTGKYVTSVAHQHGVRSEVGAELVVFSRYPLEVDHREADAQAITAAAVDEL